MQAKLLAVVSVLLFNFGVTTARERCCPQTITSQAPEMVIFRNVAAPEIERCAPSFRELILPPIRAELPLGLGYFPSAVSYVASCFDPILDEYDTLCDRVPVSGPNSCLTLAAPVSPAWAPLVRSIIL